MSRTSSFPLLLFALLLFALGSAPCVAGCFNGSELAACTYTDPTGCDSPNAQTTTTSGQGETGGTGAMSGSDSAGSGSSTGQAVPPPAILAVDMPEEVPSAGPVPFTAVTENAATVRAKLDGVELGALKDEGGGVFSGAVTVFGSVDNGAHVLEVIAERGEEADRRSVPFKVSAPAPGTLAWTQAGPAGSRARRLALTEAGDVLELGTQLIDKTPVPLLRKRSGINGAELWAEVLDFHEGKAEDIAVAPDGSLWVAVNVRENGMWRPRIMLLDEAGLFTGVELPTEVGQTVKGLDNDGTGGCFAVGFVGTADGDTDIVVWRINGDHVPLLGGESWDNVPTPKHEPHWFTDIASDVVVRDGVAWIVGVSTGIHELDPEKKTRSRGLVLRMDTDTAEVLKPVIVAEESGVFTQSMFISGEAHPDGVLVTGTGCDDACETQRVETALITADGARLWFRPEIPSSVAYGSAVTLDALGRVLVAATVHDGTTLRGHLLARVVYDEQAEPFAVAFPASNEPSEATGLVIDPFRRIYVSGYRTSGGMPQSRLSLVHP